VLLVVSIRTVIGLVIAMMLTVAAVEPTLIFGPVNKPTLEFDLRPVIKVFAFDTESLHPTRI
jgi:hypothetical protein